MVEPVMVTIRASGEIERRLLGEEDVPGMEEIRGILGGDVQEIPYFMNYDGVNCLAFHIVDGKTKGFPVNIKATSSWRDQGLGFGGDYLCGDVVILCGNREFLEKL